MKEASPVKKIDHQSSLNEQAIPLTAVFNEFNSHFKINQNKDILFTGKFGIGKTFFLNKYFNEPSLKEEFNSIIISPVNYIVSSNENIFELIKIDIIKQLFENGYIQYSEDIEYDKLSVLIKYAHKRPLSLLKNLTEALSKISVEMELTSKVSKGVFELVEDISKFETKLNEQIEISSKKLEKYQAEFENTLGTFLENNLITQIIKEALSELKKKGKRNVLIIDDLERLDPAHIFRIFNILSAHNNKITGENKFGFDKIIIVCDINNIRRIYKHFYGPFTDFSGYIDKFYSIKPYEFKNYEAINSFLRNGIKINIPDQLLIVVANVLSFMVDIGVMSLRKIFKADFFEYESSATIIEEQIILSKNDYREYIYPNHIASKRIKVSKADVPVIYFFEIMELLLGRIEFRSTILKLSKDNFRVINRELVIDFLKSIVLAERILKRGKNNMSIYTSEPRTFEYPNGNICGYSYQIVCQWNSTNRYNGEASYFLNSNIQFLDTNTFKPIDFDNMPFKIFFTKMLEFYDFYKNSF